MESQYLSMPLTDSSRHFAHAADLMRAAMQREFESEMRGLIMAARMHGFRLEINGDRMTCKAIDSQRLS
jgi:hypothetical protein